MHKNVALSEKQILLRHVSSSSTQGRMSITTVFLSPDMYVLSSKLSEAAAHHL
jgi:hypothetical protein